MSTRYFICKLLVGGCCLLDHSTRPTARLAWDLECIVLSLVVVSDLTTPDVALTLARAAEDDFNGGLHSDYPMELV